MREKEGFSLMELLVVLGIMSLLMGLIIPSVGVVREKAQRLSTGHKVRQIALAVATYQSATGRALGGEDLAGWMERLARENGPLAAELFLFEEDPLMAVLDRPPPALLEAGASGQWRVISDFSRWPIGVAVASGIGPGNDPARTPVVWTRGLEADGQWRDFGGERSGIYGNAGGFIGFLDGHVSFYRDLREDGGQLLHAETGRRTANILEALPHGAQVYDYRGRVF